MSAVPPFLVLNSDCDASLQWLANQMADVDLNLVQTFSLRDAQSADKPNHCSHHGSQPCNCQVVIFLVYRTGCHTPLTLMIQGYDQFTLFYMVDSSQQHADPNVEAAVRSALSPAPVHLLAPVDRTGV